MMDLELCQQEFKLESVMKFTKQIKSILEKVKLAIYVRNRPATEPVMLKVHNVKLSFDI